MHSRPLEARRADQGRFCPQPRRDAALPTPYQGRLASRLGDRTFPLFKLPPNSSPWGIITAAPGNEYMSTVYLQSSVQGRP